MRIRNRSLVAVITVSLVGGMAASGCGPHSNSRRNPLGSVVCESTMTSALLPTGSVTASSTGCAENVDGESECYEATVSCPDIGTDEALLKYHPAGGVTLGTIVLTTGGGGEALYEDDFTYGAELIADLNAAGYATVQVAWVQPWSDGPGGVARLGCRYATVAEWIYNELHATGASAPFCATGNSGGSTQVAYALSRYGLDQILDAAVLSSGPPHGRIDMGCDCSNGPQTVAVPCGSNNICYSPARAESIDAGYDGSPCAGGCVDVLESDSVAAPGADLDYPDTRIVAIFGSQDESNAVAQGMQWYNAITSEVQIECVPEAGHPVASSLEGYEAIRDELLAECQLSP